MSHSSSLDMNKSWTFGLLYAKSEYVFFLGDDALIMPSIIGVFVDIVRQHASVDLVGFNTMPISESGSTLDMTYFPKHCYPYGESSPIFVDTNSPIFPHTPPIMSSILKRSKLMNIGIFPCEGLACDVWAFRVLSVSGSYWTYNTSESVLCRRASYSASSSILRHATDNLLALNQFKNKHGFLSKEVELRVAIKLVSSIVKKGALTLVLISEISWISSFQFKILLIIALAKKSYSYFAKTIFRA